MNAVKAKPRYLAGPSPVHVLKAVEATVVLMENLVMQLAFRWLDESEYEDFADYEKRMKDVLAEKTVGLTFVKGTKRPFGFHFKVDGFGGVYSVQCSTRSYGWKRVS